MLIWKISKKCCINCKNVQQHCKIYALIYIYYIDHQIFLIVFEKWNHFMNVKRYFQKLYSENFLFIFLRFAYIF